MEPPREGLGAPQPVSVFRGSQAASLESHGLEALRKRGAIGSLEEQDGVHEVDPAGAGGDRPPGGDGGRVEPLALDITDFAPFGR